LCASIASFVAHGASARAGAITSNHRIFVSPKPENTPERIPRLLVHELSHLHLAQHLGLIRAASLPVWFSEGLAVDVSDGAGAEGVSEGDARSAIERGNAFVPDEGSLWSHPGAGAAHLAEHLFYREAALFIAHLRALSPRGFHALLDSLERDGDFGSAFRAAYHEPVANEWARFVRNVRRMASRGAEGFGQPMGVRSE
jgi:hypothetical protein